MNAVLAPATAPARCSRCEGRKTVFSPLARRRVRCPACTGTGTADAERVTAQLTAIEKRRIDSAQRQIDAAIAQALCATKRLGVIEDPGKRAVDRIMQRWAVGHGSGLPVEDPGALAAAPPRLDDETQIIIDRIVNRSPQAVQSFLHQWYRSSAAAEAMADRQGISVRSLYRRWTWTLEWLEAMFRASKHPALLRLMGLESR